VNGEQQAIEDVKALGVGSRCEYVADVIGGATVTRLDRDRLRGASAGRLRARPRAGGRCAPMTPAPDENDRLG
jgi:hypothetical protein